eukprot:1156841-Pelagomonas_calceolata.AAC.6
MGLPFPLLLLAPGLGGLGFCSWGADGAAWARTSGLRIAPEQQGQPGAWPWTPWRVAFEAPMPLEKCLKYFLADSP